MSDKNKNKRNILKDFFRYHRDELSGGDRNSFERDLQKDPFAEEAAEGFSSISQEESSKDIANLGKRLRNRTSGKYRIFIYRIAASIAVLMTISALFFIIEKNKTVNKLADNTIQSKTLEINKVQPLTEPYSKDRASGKLQVTGEKKTVKSAARNVTGSMEPPKSAGSVEKLKTTVSLINDTINEYKEEASNIYVADEIMAAPVKARSKEFAAQADSRGQVKPDTSISGLSEVVVVGYGAKKTDSDTEETISGHTPPLPSIGKSKFDKYIRENLHRPDTLTAGQRFVVVARFLVRTDGGIDSIRIVRSPGRLFSDEAIRVIKSGPSWKPAENNGQPIEDSVTLRLVFR